MSSVGHNNRNVRTKSYRDCLAKLPEEIVALAEAAFQVFERDPEDPSLDNHPLADGGRGRHRLQSRAVRVTRRYRAIYVVDGDTNVWYWIGSHSSYNVFTGRK